MAVYSLSYDYMSEIAASLINFVIVLLSLILFIRFGLVLPAASLDKAFSLGDAAKHIKGYGENFFWILLLIGLPAAAVLFALTVALYLVFLQTKDITVILHLIFIVGPVSYISLALCSSALALMFQRLAASPSDASSE
ncbi:MAG: hypothetical protein O7A65_03585 [Proteobacteria bacterium]|nr:hypothetical protein [Pseudomonadota bacterium]